MKFATAVERLGKESGNRFRYLTFKVTFPREGEKWTECQLYVDGDGCFDTGRTWDEAFEERSDRINNVKPKIEELPEEDEVRK